MNDYSDIKIGKMIHQMKIHQSDENDGITLFLGAGCSLASSPHDISTYGIVKNIVETQLEDISGMPDTWNELYKTFINIAWNGLGKKDKINLLKPYFNDLKPSEGYLAIKYLIEHGYVQNIITTNFDPLIDKILENIPHRKIVGELTSELGDNPKITFIKAHGDLKYGNLRFSPFELQKLPAELENKIRQLTKGIVIVVGYRGQDIGIMNSLNTSDDHCAFWVSPTKPEIYDGYTNDPIYDWMKKRNSEGNFIYGEYGDFNILFPTLVRKLSALPNETFKTVEIWKNSFLFDTISLSKRISLVFSILLKIEHELLDIYEWKIQAPYFSEASSSLLSILINICQDKILPQNSISKIANGVEALILAFALDIYAQTQGYPIVPIKFIDNIKARYEIHPDAPRLNDDFWDLLKRLFLIEKNAQNYYEIIVTFDINKDFSYVLKKGEFSEIQSLFSMIKIIALFEKTAFSHNKLPSYEYRAKILLENNCKKIEPSARATTITLEDLTQEDDRILRKYLLDMYAPFHSTLGTRQTYFIESIYIVYDVDNKSGQELGLYDELLQKSKEFCCNFFEKINLENFIITDVVNVLHDFLDSINSGFMLLGASGSGKTTLLGYLIKNLQNTSNFVILPFSGREQRLLQRGINVFSNWFSDFEKLEVINKLFLCREQTLVLVYDALNEMPGDFNFLQDNYNELIKFTEMLSQKEYRNIKIILSLRTDSYLQLRQNEALEPRPGVFYTPLAENRTIFPLYQLPVFSESQTLKLLQKETSLNRQILKKLYHEFSSILQTPFYIQLFGQILCSFSDLGEKEFAIFSLKWYDAIFNNIAKDEVIQNELSNVTEAIILVKYQYEGRKVFINDIVRKMHIAKEKLEKDILKLQSSGILAYEKTTGQINFSHESYEQIFLTKYLTQIDNPENFCASIYEKQKSPTILTLSLLDYLRIQKYFNSENYLNILLRFLTRDNYSLTKVLIESILKMQEEQPVEDFWIALFNKIDYRIGLDYHSKFLIAILQEINNLLDEKQQFSIKILDSLNPIIYTTYNINPIIDSDDQAYYEFIYAKYLYVFAYKFENDVFYQAKVHCAKASNLLIASKNSLHDDIDILYAILLRYEGKLNDSVELLKKVLDNQLKHLVPDKTCQTALELGAIYRELTRFDDAMTVYEKIENTCNLSAYWNARLKLNTGIILKNRLQLRISEGNVSFSDYENYKKTEEFFKFVYHYAKTCDDVLLQLEIQAELIELCAIAQYFQINSVSSARNYITEMEKILKKYPVPLRRIQYYRMLARVQILEKNYEKALNSLREGYQLSIKYNIPYRACDCCRKFAQIILEHNRSDISLLQEAQRYIAYAISYYKSLNATDHLYFLEAQKLQKNIDELLNCQGPV